MVFEKPNINVVSGKVNEVFFMEVGPSYARPSLIQFRLKDKNKSKLVCRRVVFAVFS